jgi:hypothetical protein
MKKAHYQNNTLPEWCLLSLYVCVQIKLSLPQNPAVAAHARLEVVSKNKNVIAAFAYSCFERHAAFIVVASCSTSSILPKPAAAACCQ